MRLSGEAGYSHIPRFCQAAPVHLDALNFVQGLGGEIALTAMWAHNHRNVLDEQEVRPLAVAPRHVPDLGAILAADVAIDRWFLHAIHRKP